MARRRISLTDGLTAVAAVRAGEAQRVVGDPQFATAVRFLLEDLAERVPGGSVEVRVPPLGAVQCVPGSNHRRGTPPNVTELNPADWFALAVGEVSWEALLATGRVHCSGVQAADFVPVLPLVRPAP